MREKRMSLTTFWYATWEAVVVQTSGGSVPFGMMKWEELALQTSSVAESSTDGRGLCLRLLSASSGRLAILLAPASDASVSSNQLVVGIGPHQFVRAPATVLGQK